MAQANNNTDRLIQRITDAAQDEAAVFLAKAHEECRRNALIAKDELFGVETAAQVRIRRERTEIIERSRTNAELDSRKYFLAARRRVLDAAFEQAEQSLMALNGDARRAFLQRMLLCEAEGGERVEVAASDESTLNAELVRSVNEQLAAQGKSPLTLGSTNAPIAGGFILHAAGYEKNCSFEALLRDVRTAHESEAAAILFG